MSVAVGVGIVGIDDCEWLITVSVDLDTVYCIWW